MIRSRRTSLAALLCALLAWSTLPAASQEKTAAPAKQTATTPKKTTASKTSAAAPKKAATRPAAVPADLSAAKSLGAATAPVTVEVFSDFQCPACRALYEGTLRPLIDNYVQNGRVYLVHRDFPLDIHAHSRAAARYANAAARIGKFEKAEQALYARQDYWASDGNVEAALALVMSPADMKKIRQVVQDPAALDAAINSDQRLGNAVPVRSTPTVVVKHQGKSYPLPAGGVNYSLLTQFIDDLIRQSRGR